MVNANNDYRIDKALISKNKTKKRQIILTNTSCPIDDYFTKLRFRYNKKFNRVPAYTIDRSGTLYIHFDPGYHTNFFEDETLNKIAIAISLENVGWVNYIENKNMYVDWRGIPYNGNVINKVWRNKRYWAEYTEAQFNTLLELIDYLCIEYRIEKKFIGHNVFFDDALKFNGILNLSNYSKYYNDLNPAFDFQKLTKKINE